MVFLQINAVAIVIILMIHVQNNMFLMLLKNIKVFTLMSITNETRHIELHENCKCKCRLNPNVCNNKQR